MQEIIEELKDIMFGRMSMNPRIRSQFHKGTERDKLIEILNKINDRLEKLEQKEER